MMDGERWTFELRQDGQVVAEGEAQNQADAQREGFHYALMYAQDGPVELKIARSDSSSPAER